MRCQSSRITGCRNTAAAITVGSTAPASSPNGEFASSKNLLSSASPSSWRISNHGGALADHGLDHRQLEVITEVWPDRRQVDDQGVLDEGRQGRRGDKQRCLRQAAQDRRDPPSLQGPLNHQTGKLQP
jgi:hypothetical protein